MDRLSPERRSENMRRIKSKDSGPEMRVRRLVHGLGYRYRLHSPSLPGRPDLTLARLGKIIEVRGCFWHQHPGCGHAHMPKTRRGYWKPKLEGNTARDRANVRKLRRLGWRVLIVWECQTAAAGRLEARLRRFLAE